MGKTHIKVATIVASSTDTAWSQAYHAGGVTAIVSVRQKESTDSSPSLSLVGKDLLNTFESEYFTLETKNLASIKKAVEITYNKSKDTHAISLIVTASIQNAVYVILAGTGKILLLRKGSLATLLEQQEGDEVLSASGFLESSDTMILETLSFEAMIPTHTLVETLTANTPSDAAEILSPTIHKEKDGSAAALIFTYQEDAPTAEPVTLPMEEKEEEHHEKKEEEGENEREPVIIASPPVHQKHTRHITHRQKIFLTIAVILVIVLGATIYFSLQKKELTQNSALFSQLYPPAERKYEEGQGLESLNASLAHSDYQEAQQMLTAAKSKFPANSSEEKQILALLDKVNAKLTPSTSGPTTSLTKVSSGADAFLDFAAAHTSEKYFAQDDTNYYFADANGISKVTKSGGTAKQIIQNSGDYKTLGGFETYLGNMYLLDTSDGIDKYTAGSGGFGNKTAYFSSNTPDLSKGVSIAIDGSIWVLNSNGTITKYTKGVQDSLTVSGLSKPLANPTQIVTTVDDDNVYILDNGNSRLVVLKKDGTFVADYTNPQLTPATQLDVQESAKKAYVLSGGSVYELDLK